jgi:small-conductance mechanosensitive channel
MDEYLFAASFEPAALLPALYYTLAGVVIGFIFEKIFLVRLRNAAKKADWEGALIATDALRGLGSWVVGLVGLYYAVPTLLLKEDIVTGLQQGILVAGIAIVTWIIRRASVHLVSAHTQKTGAAFPSSSIFTHLTQIAILSIGLLVALQTLNISITPIITAMGVGGLAVALGLQDTMANLFSGVTVLASKKMVPGDIIELEGGKKGTVKDISWRYTTIKTPGAHTVVIPNSKLAGETVTNFSQPNPEVSFAVAVRLPFDVDLEEMEVLLRDTCYAVMQSTEGASQDYIPVVRFQQFGEIGIETKVFLKAENHGAQYAIKHACMKNIYSELTQRGITIPHQLTEHGRP